MNKYVVADRLNFRAEPEGQIMGRLHLGQSVDELGAADVSGWVRIRATVNGGPAEGFVAARFLRADAGVERETLVAVAVEQWLRFDMGGGKEHKDPFAGFVGEMWQAIGMDLDGRDRDVPWSAAAISFFVRRAGERLPSSTYGAFRFAAAHARYIHDSIHKRLAANPDAPFWGFDIDEQRPDIGDLVCRNRGDGVSFETATATAFFKSHCDVVVAVRDDHVVTLGGNVSHTVKITRYPLTPGGFLDGDGNVFALLANRH